MGHVCDKEKLFSIFVWINVLTYFTTNGTVVTHVEPSYGSLAGETRLTIHGSEFSTAFSFNADDIVGNLVFLVSGKAVVCDVDTYASTERQIICTTPSGLSEEDYYVKVVVDGLTVIDADLCNGRPTSSNCTYKPRLSYTPTIDTLSPHSGMPGTIVTMHGKLFTDSYDSTTTTASNGKEDKIRRVYVGFLDCDLKDGDDFYGLALDDEYSDYGTLKCKHKINSPGNYNASFITGPQYGRSLRSNKLRVAHDDTLHMFQVYTSITAISQSMGSTAGGLSLTIYADHIDDRATAPRAYAGDTECIITEAVLDKKIVCTVAPDPEHVTTTYAGNRGLIHEYWNSVYYNLDEIRSLTSSDPGYGSGWLDEFYFVDKDMMDNYVSRTTSYFKAPFSGSYQFMLKADDEARLYVDGVAMVTSLKSWQWSERMNFTKGQHYLLEVTHYETNEDSYIHLKVKFFYTKLTNAMTGNAEQETQTIRFTSDVTPETQRLNFHTFGNQSPVHEIQTVAVDIQPPDGHFRFGLFGVYSAPLNYDDAEEAAADVINNLPIFGTGESVTVVRDQTSNTTQTFVVTFLSDRGDFPNLEIIKVVNSTDLNFTVTEVIKGKPNLDVIALELEGVVSEPFSVAAVNSGILGGILEDLFNVKCPSVFEGSGSAIYYAYQSFEADSDLVTGTRVKNTEPFCGRYALKNPNIIYRQTEGELGLMLSNYDTLCFAYKGFLQSVIGVTYTLRQATDGEVVTKTNNFTHTFQTDSSEKSTPWYYTCENIYTLVFIKHPTDTEHRVTEVFVYNENSQQDAYIDSVYIGQGVTTDDPEASLLRRLSARPNEAYIESVSVTAVAASEYEVTIIPYDCGYDFPLFELSNAQVTSGGVSSPSDSVTMTLNNGDGSGVLNVTRLSSASPPITGSFHVTFDGNSVAINAAAEPFDIEHDLESLHGIGDVDVTKTGDCRNYNYTVTFLSLPGDILEMTVTHDQLSGNNVAVGVVTNKDGGLWYDPIPGDLLATVHSDPQVSIYINDVPSACSGECSFNWDSGSTPSVTEVIQPYGTLALGTSIVIRGTGFSSTYTDNRVTIADVPCSVTSSTTTNITCDVGNGPSGTYAVNVNVAGKGDAVIVGLADFTYPANISSISPNAGSQGGGVIITIGGYGFRPDAHVTINSATCPVLAILPDEIQCLVPLSPTEGTYVVEVQQGEATLTFAGFSYLASLTPLISSVTPSKLSVTGGSLSISGSGFGVTTGTVILGLQAVTVESWTDTSIVVNVKVIKAGYLDLLVNISSGIAVNESFKIPTVKVGPSVTNIHPGWGSIQGGTQITLSGSGFGTDVTLASITLGDYICDVDTLSDSTAVIQIADYGKIHDVTYTGTDPGNSAFHITIIVGDSVHWSWDVPLYVNNIKYRIYQVDSLGSTSATDGGFNSGSLTRNGDYTHQFFKVGIYYVWSGYINEWKTGTIEVVTASSSTATINMYVAGVEAVHEVGGAPDPVDNSVCQSTISAMGGCVDSQPSGGDTSRFNFAFWTCSTPIVNSINVNNGTAQTTITISGDGFSSEDCQNEITFGGYACDITFSSETEVSCTISKLEEPELGVLHQLKLRVNNRGNALISITSEEDRGFRLVPHIEAIQPTAGSIEGGTRVTLTGFGFGDNPLVNIGIDQCTIVKRTYKEIICETPSSQAALGDVTVVVSGDGSPQNAECKTITGTCQYSYDITLTPEVYTVDPDVMSSTTTFNITGSSFGTDAASVEVYIGSVVATVISAQETYLLASIDNIATGDNIVIVRVLGYGKASGSLTVSGTLIIASISPLSGSIHGGTTITIHGNGFVENDVTVTVGGTTCDITSTTMAEVVCVTGAHVAGSVNVEVTTNGENYSLHSFSYSLDSTPTVGSVSPVFGFSGDTLTIYGSNFGGMGVTVTLDGVNCAVSASSNTQIQCLLGNHDTDQVPVSVYVDGLGTSNSDVIFHYELELVSSNPTAGSKAGKQKLFLLGNGFTDSATVTVCGVTCPRVSSTTTTYTCETPSSHAQTCSVTVTINGFSKTLPDVYTYSEALTPSVSGVTPVRGGTAGGTTITITGSKFGSSVGDVRVVIDGVKCDVASVTDTRIACITGPHLGSGNTKVEVDVSGNGIAEETVSGDADFSYINMWSSTFTWNGKPPPQAGEFVVIPASMTVLLDTDTPVLSVLHIQGGKLIFDDKDIELKSNVIMITDGGLLQVGTEEQPFPSQYKAIITLHGHTQMKVLPICGTKTLSVRSGALDLHGAVVHHTWTKLSATASAGDTIIELVDAVDWKVGDEIVISTTGHCHSQNETEKNTIAAVSDNKMTLTLTDTLKASHLGTADILNGIRVELRAAVGLLTRNVVVRGSLHTAWHDEIKGCPKAFEPGLFQTNICFRGRFAGDTIIELVDAVDWKVGDEIVISTTGHYHSQNETEKNTIAAVSDNKMTLTLTDTLKASHWDTTDILNGIRVELRAAIGLLTRNVGVRGSLHTVWHDESKGCPKAFEPGQFQTNTCFPGRLSEEIGGDQFGAQIMIHTQGPANVVHSQAHLKYIEISHAGQAFRLGRYPIHFHLNGDMSTSYVRGCSIHTTFNRAVHIHQTHNLSVENNVFYDIMGNACFMEDGIETGNTFQFNLIMFVRGSTSLQNDDVTPAAFWGTTPNNTVQHNHAAGGTHFGFWYRTHKKPSPRLTYDTTVGVGNVSLGIFNNNTVHSFGRTGLRISEDYTPVQGGTMFKGLVAWSNDKDVEYVNTGSVQEISMFSDVHVSPRTYDCPLISDSLIVGTTTVIPESKQGCTRGGIIFPHGRGVSAINITFVNFDTPQSAAFAWTNDASSSHSHFGGFTYHTGDISFINTRNKAKFEWEYQAVIQDTDGSLTGKPANWTILPTSGTLPNDCEQASAFSVGEPASICPSLYKWHRFVLVNILPASIEGTQLIIKNQYGNSSVPFVENRLRNESGWMAILVEGGEYKLQFGNVDQISNINFTGLFYDFEPDNYVFIRLPFMGIPDFVSIDGGKTSMNMTTGGIDPATANIGDWEWDDINDEILFIVHGRKRSRRDTITYVVDPQIQFTALKYAT